MDRPSPLCRIELLGELCLAVGQERIIRFPTCKTASLLAVLAYAPSLGYPREPLTKMLWPEAPPEAGRNRLSTALVALRARARATRYCHGRAARGGSRFCSAHVHLLVRSASPGSEKKQQDAQQHQNNAYHQPLILIQPGQLQALQSMQCQPDQQQHDRQSSHCHDGADRD